MKTLPTSKMPDRRLYVSRSQRIRARTGGFTLIEMIVVITIGAIIAMAIYRTLGAQQSFFRRQKSAAIQQDALRSLDGSVFEQRRGDGPGSGLCGALRALGFGGPITAWPMPSMIVLMSAKSRLMMPVIVMMSEIP